MLSLVVCVVQTCHGKVTRNFTQQQGPDPDPLDRVLSSSFDSGTRKVVSYTLQQRSHGKL